MFKRQIPWAQSSIYQIYPRSFKDSSDDGVGDIKGIIEKLDYLDDLGISAIWLSPIYKSPMKDFGYDVSDYYDIDPIFGTLEDMDRLIAESHDRGIKIMVDYIPNHTSSMHPWFLESKSSRHNPKRDWYIWKDPKLDGTAPNNWLSFFGGPAWEYDGQTKQYYLHSFLKEQPDLNWRNHEVKQAMFDVMRFWLKRGIDGFRVDALSSVYKDERFLDEPYISKGKPDPYRPFLNLEHIYTLNQPAVLDWIHEASQLLTQYGEHKFMISETYARDKRLKTLLLWYKAGISNINAPFNFHLIRLPWDARKYKFFIDRYLEELNTHFIPDYVLGNHDQSRVASRIGQSNARIAAMLTMTLPGIPVIYYGEEIGMEDAVIPKEKITDPHRRLVRGKIVSRDPQRTPMQWNRRKYSGFSQSLPWLPVHENYRTVNAESENKAPQSMLSFYRRLLALRKGSNALLSGKYIPLPLANKTVFCYIREFEKEKMLVLLNFSGSEKTVDVSYKKISHVLSTYLDRKNSAVKNGKIILRPHEGKLFTMLYY